MRPLVQRVLLRQLRPVREIVPQELEPSETHEPRTRDEQTARLRQVRRELRYREGPADAPEVQTPQTKAVLLRSVRRQV